MHMKRKEAAQWIERNEKRKQLFLHFTQPMTAKQMAQKTGMSLGECSLILGQLVLCRLVKCLNPSAVRSRIYWLTPTGIFCQRKISNQKNLPKSLKKLPDIDWELYGWICYSHRSAVIKALTEPMQPAKIKRKITQSNRRAKISANNVRDIIRLFVKKGIVEPVQYRKEAHPRYELTQIGKALQSFLIQSQVNAISKK